MRTSVLAALAVLVAIGLPALAEPPKSAQFTLDGVEYLYITGVNRTESVVLGAAANGTEQLPIEGCAFVMLHPGTPNGRVAVHTVQGGLVPIDLYIEQFRLPNGTNGYAYDALVQEDGTKVAADVAITGNASLRVASRTYYDPLGSTGTKEIDRDLDDMTGTVAVVRTGLRNDTTSALVPVTEQVADEELHIHVRSAPETQPFTNTTVFTSGLTPAPPSEAYGATHSFFNTKFGGEATLDISTSAQAPPGMNRFNINVIAPMGDSVVNVTLEPSLLSDASTTATFPLDEFGTYIIQVTGDVALGTYSIEASLVPLPALDLHMWWENVTYGYQAYEDYRACLKSTGSPNSIVATERVVGRPNPPQFRLTYVILGVVAVLAVATIAVKLASDQVSLSAFRKGK